MDKQDSGEDRISALPDDIICNILSNLYVEESARTSILSKRWRNMWLLSPINISDESIVKQSCIYCFAQEKSSSWIVNAMSHIISTHPGPIPTCHFILPDWHEYQETLVTLLKTLTLKGIRNLQIYLRDFKVPCFVLECDSLVDVQLRGCLMPAQLLARRDIFPNLRKLTLIEYDMDNKLLVNLLSSRSIIELALVGCYGFGGVVIESDSLQKFYFKGTDDYDHVYTVVIKDVPNLESFKCDDGLSSKVAILNAPKLKVLSRIEMNMPLLQLGNYQFNFNGRCGMRISGEITYMPSLRSLDIAVDSADGVRVKFVPYFLMCFPCLGSLEVYFDSFYCKHHRNYKGMVGADVDAAIVVDGDYDDHVRMISNIYCLNHHLKSVRLSGFYGIPAHFDFARLIVANAKVLETLTIVYGRAYEERWMKAQKHYLMQNSASKMVRVEFLKRVETELNIHTVRR